MDLHKVVAKTQKNTNTLPALHFTRDVTAELADDKIRSGDLTQLKSRLVSGRDSTVFDDP